MKKFTKLFISSILIVLLGVMSFVLVACKPKENEIVDPVEMTTNEALDKIFNSFAGSDTVLSIDFASDIAVNDKNYKLEVKANLAESKDVEFGLIFTDKESNDKFAVYIVNGKFYLSSVGKDIYLEDFDTEWLIDQLLKLENIESTINGLLNGFMPGATIGDLLDTMLPLYFGFNPETDYVKEGNIETIKLEFLLNDLLDMVLGLLNESVDLDAMLADLGIQFNDFSIGDFISSLEIPVFNINITSVIDNGINKSTEVDVKMDDEELIDVVFNLTLGNGKLEFIPENIATFIPFSFTNIQFKADLELEGNSVDVANIVNLFVGYEMLTPGQIILNAGLGLVLTARIDLSLTDNNENLILLEIADKSDLSKVLLGAYYYNGKVYVTYENLLTGINNSFNIPGVQVLGVNITQELTNLTNLIKSSIEGLLDQLEAGNDEVAKAQPVVAMSMKNSGSLISPSLATLINSMADILWLKDNINVSENNIHIDINQGFFDGLKQLAGLNVPVPDFGSVGIDFNLNQSGLSDVNIALDMTQYGLAANLNINNFLIGYTPEGLKADIENAIDGKTFASNLNDIIYDAIKGVDISANGKLNFKAGIYSISDLLKTFGVDLPNLEMEFTEDLSIDASIDFQMSSDKTKLSEMEMRLDVIINEDFIYAEAGKLLSIYYKGGFFYIDLSNIKIANVKMPMIKVEFDLAAELSKALDSIDIDFVLGGGEAKSNFRAAYASSIENILNSNIEESAFYLKATSVAINNILQQFGVGFTLPEFDISLGINSLDEMRLEFYAPNGDIEKSINFNFVFDKLQFGTTVDDVTNGLNEDDYKADITKAILESLKTLDISGSLDLFANKTKIDVQDLVNRILVLSGKYFTIPIELDIDNFTNEYFAELKWRLDYDNPIASTALFEIKLSQSELLIGFYVENGSLYLDLTRLGLMKLEIKNTQIVVNLVNYIKSLSIVETDTEEVVRTVLRNGNISASDLVAEAMESAGAYSEPKSILELILENIFIKDKTLGLNFSVDVIAELLRNALVDLGFDLSADASLNILDGVISGHVIAGDVSLGLELNLNSLGGDVAVNLESKNLGEYPEYNAESGLSLVNSIFDNLSPELWIDSRMNSIDTGSTIFTRIGMFKAPRDQSYGAAFAPKDSYVITISNGWNNESKNIMVYAILNIRDNVLSISGTSQWFSKFFGIGSLGATVDGTMIKFDIPLNTDIKTLIADAIGPIIDEINKPMVDGAESENGGIAVTYANEAATNDSLDVMTLFRGININLYNNGDIRLRVNFNAQAFNDLINTTLKTLFTDLDASSITGKPGTVTIDYDPYNKNVFYNSFYTNIVEPIVQAEIDKTPGASLLASQVKSYIKENLQGLIYRVLPLPQFTELTIDVNINGGKLDNIYINGTDKNKGHFLDFRLFNDMADDVVGWYDLESNYHQKLNITYDALGDEELKDLFIAKAYKHNPDGDYRDGQTVAWAVKDLDGNMIPFTRDDLSFFKENGVYKAGVYYITGTAYGETINVVLEIKSGMPKNAEITEIEDVSVGPNGELPSSVNAKWVLKETIKGEDGAEDTTVVVDSGNVTIDGVTITAPRTEIGAHSVTGTVTIKGKEYSIKVIYDDSTLTLYDTEPYVTSADTYKTFLNDVLRLRMMSLNGTLKYYDVVFDKTVLNNLTDEEWLKGGDYVIKGTINKGTDLEQTFDIPVFIENREVDYVRIDSKDKVIISPYDTLNDRVYPETVTVYYKGGDVKEISVDWKTDDVKYDVSGIYNATISNVNGDIKWNHSVSVVVEDVDVKYALFNGDRELNINPYEYMSNPDGIFPTSVTALMTNGDTVIFDNVVWDLSNLEVTPDGGQYRVKLTLEQGSFLERTITVPVNVEALNITDISVKNIELNILEVLYGNKTLADLMPAQMEFVLGSGNKIMLDVEWDLSNIVIDIIGGEYLATATIGSGIYEQTYSINIKVVSSKLSVSEEKSIITISYDEYLVKGEEYYFTPTYEILIGGKSMVANVEWYTDNVSVNAEGGTYEATLYINKGGANEQSCNITVVVLPSQTK